MLYLSQNCTDDFILHEYIRKKEENAIRIDTVISPTRFIIKPLQK